MPDNKKNEINLLVEKALSEKPEIESSTEESIPSATPAPPPEEPPAEEIPIKGITDEEIGEELPPELMEEEEKALEESAKKPKKEKLKEKVREEKKKEKKYITIKRFCIPVSYIVIPIASIISILLFLFLYSWITSEGRFIEINSVTEPEVEAVEEPEAERPEEKFKRFYYIDVDELIVTIENKMVNPHDIVYFKLNISIELSTETLKTEIEDKMPQVKDAIVSIISTKSLPEIGTTEGKLKLKDDIRRKINSFLIGGKITDVYFKQYVYQL